MTTLQKIVSFLDRQLNIAAFQDDSNNGLRAQNSGKVQRACVGVDASMAFFERAAERKADLMICHHGLSWGDSLKRITGLNYRRMKFLLDRDMALYACHLPLDAHPRLGNNAQICKALGLTGLKPFGFSHGVARIPGLFAEAQSSKSTPTPCSGTRWGRWISVRRECGRLPSCPGARAAGSRKLARPAWMCISPESRS
ncbi:MAG TPA: Nif3-like dinuclear metal center hexameric protein [Acidobacteriota bacterium]|nr:Nif3-like dinuclear metal center hexameric protein [Acidobacteriota bacterium]